MAEINTGGPAFMVAELANIKHEGMTLRDYFAAKAMQSLIACVWERHGDTNYIIDMDGRVSLHLRAYEHADAMLAAREQS